MIIRNSNGSHGAIFDSIYSNNREARAALPAGSGQVIQGLWHNHPTRPSADQQAIDRYPSPGDWTNMQEPATRPSVGSNPTIWITGPDGITRGFQLSERGCFESLSQSQQFLVTALWDESAIEHVLPSDIACEGYMKAFILFFAVGTGQDHIVSEHVRGLESERVVVEHVCRSHTFRFQIAGTGLPNRKSEVSVVSVDGHHVPGAADQLTRQAAGRWIEKIGLINCGLDSEPGDVLGVIRMSEIESTREGSPALIVFRLRLIDGNWTATFE